MRYIVVAAILLLSGCGLSQSYRVESNRSASNLSLCQSLQNKDNYLKYLPKQYKTDLENEVTSRGINCGNIISSEEQRLASERVLDQERDRQTLRKLDSLVGKTVDVLAAMGANQAQQSAANTSTGMGVTCRKKYEWTSGVNKNCSYDCLGSEAVQTISSAQICPISITR